MLKPVDGYEGLYSISPDGKVYSHVSGKYLRYSVHRDGYLKAFLTKGGKTRCYLVHRLVAKAYLQEPDARKTQVNHIDGNKRNNRAANLEWCTAKENIRHAIHVLGERKKPVTQKAKNGIVIASWPSIVEASAATGVLAQNIWRNANGIRPSAGGYVWEYA